MPAAATPVLAVAKGATCVKCHTCQIAGRDGGRCPDQAEVKLADSRGDSAWVCLPHSEEILVTMHAAFISSHNGRGLAEFRAGH